MERQINLICYYGLIVLLNTSGIRILLSSLLCMMVTIDNVRFAEILKACVFLGSLKKASFDMKTFANELCRFICESLSDKVKLGLVLSNMAPRRFGDFQWYFGKSDLA